MKEGAMRVIGVLLVVLVLGTAPAMASGWKDAAPGFQDPAHHNHWPGHNYYYGHRPPPPVYYAPPPPVYYAPPPPVYFVPQPRYYHPPPVYYVPRPRYYHPRPRAGIYFGF
jgi:hypothetical protein